MKRIVFLTLMFLTVGMPAMPASAQSTPDQLDPLIRQLGGKGCAFAATPPYNRFDRPCLPRKGVGLIDWLFRSRLECIRDAAHCLAILGPEAKPATAALIEAVRTGPNNYDTGDGTIHVRDAIVEALGRTGDARALPVLIEALETPKPVDVSYGAIPRVEPAGERAALTALGHLGPAAAAAVPRILLRLEHHNRRVAEAAAVALGAIGDASAIAALTKALDRDDIAPRAADALGRFGPAAAGALPALVRLIEVLPDRDGDVLIRQAIARIGGRAQADALPKVYHMMLSEVWRITRVRLSRYAIRLRGLHMNSPKEEFTTKLPGGGHLVVAMSRAVWRARQIAEGSITLSRPGAEPIREAYLGIDQLQQALDRMFAPSSSR